MKNYILGQCAYDSSIYLKDSLVLYIKFYLLQLICVPTRTNI